MCFNTKVKDAAMIDKNEASLIKRLRNETIHSTEKLLSALPTNRQFLNRILQK